MQFQTRASIINAVKDYPIYADEMDIIRTLLDALEPELFARVFEEVLAGNLTFGDFKQLFSGEEYAVILEQNLRTQKLVRERLDRYTEFRQKFNLSSITTFKNQNIAITDSNDPLFGEFYSAEASHVVDNLIYQLFSNLENGTLMEQTGKQAVINKIKQSYADLVQEYPLITATVERLGYGLTSNQTICVQRIGLTFKNPSMVETIGVETLKGSKIYITSKGLLTLNKANAGYNLDRTIMTYDDFANNRFKNVRINNMGNLTIRTQNITISDVLKKILFFADKQIIPLEFDNQVLDKTDIDYMIANNLTEDQVKKMKSLSLFIRKGSILELSNSLDISEGE